MAQFLVKFLFFLRLIFQNRIEGGGQDRVFDGSKTLQIVKSCRDKLCLVYRPSAAAALGD